MNAANPIQGPQRERFLDHIQTFLGPLGGVISVAPVAPNLPQIDLVHVTATESKPWQMLVTLGMSSTRMNPPDQFPDEPRFSELVLGLPADWPLEGESMKDVAFRWPLRLMATLASFPAASGQWLSVGHSVPNGDPPQPYFEEVGFCGAMLAPPITVMPEFKSLVLSKEQTVVFHAVIPLFEREMELKVSEGTKALLSRFDEHHVSEILNVERRSVAGTLLDMLDARKS
ncbi:MAG: suppressor of fused domain protein [Myxococcota bacterium]